MATSADQPNWRKTQRCASVLARSWNNYYISDCIGFFILLSAYITIELFAVPFHRMFSTSDLSISFPHAEAEKVPVLMNFVYALFLPLFIMVLYNALSGTNFHKHQVTILGIAVSLVLSGTLTGILKNMAGRPRPDLLARCKPAPGTPPATLVSVDICTETNRHLLQDGWRSFPSGHSSFAFSGLGFLSLFLAGQLKVFVRQIPAEYATAGVIGVGSNKSRPEIKQGSLGKALLCLVPLLGALMIALSRWQDYRHDVYDVTAGALLGWTVTYWSYRHYWPRLNCPDCDVPYSIPVYSRREDVEYGRLGGEEGFHSVRLSQLA